MSRFTKGPWDVWSTSDNTLDVSALKGKQVIAMIEPCGDRPKSPDCGRSEYDAPLDSPSKEEWANALLIAAAPGLYEACLAAIVSIEHFMVGGTPDFGFTLRVLNEAHAKAEGRKKVGK